MSIYRPNKNDIKYLCKYATLTDYKFDCPYRVKYNICPKDTLKNEDGHEICYTLRPLMTSENITQTEKEKINIVVRGDT